MVLRQGQTTLRPQVALPQTWAAQPTSRRPAVLDAARTALIPLRPLTIGEILDAGFLVVRRNVRLMVGLPLVIAGGTAVSPWPGWVFGCCWATPLSKGAQNALVLAMGLIGVLLLVQCLVWMTAILSRVTLQTVLGEGFAPTTSEVSLRSSWPLFWRMLGLSLLQYLASAVIQTALSIISYVALGAALLAGDDGGYLGVLAVIGVSVLTFLLMALSYGYISLTVPALATESRNAPGWIGKPYKPTTVISSFERSVKLIGLRNLGRVTLVFAGAMLVSGGLVALLAIGAWGLVLLFATSINQDLNTVLM
nr:hypothetical protein [Propionibacteriaceae bacterium]